MKRLAKKTISYGILHMIVAISVAYAITGDWVISLGIGLIEPIVQTFAFAIHDYWWEGKMPSKEEMIEHSLTHRH